MKAMVLKEYGAPLELEEFAIPEPGPQDILLKVRFCGICGTDLKIVGGKLPDIISLPHIPGHEIAGEVVAIGDRVGDVRIGDVGIAYLYISCRDCELCRSGHENICFSVRRLGFELNGGFSEYVRLPAYNFCRIRSESSLKEMSVLTDAAVTPYHALKSIAPLRQGQKLLIVGAGGLGLHAVQLARNAGARVAVADVRKEALRRAEEFGAELVFSPAESEPRSVIMQWTGGTGVDVVLEGVGIKATFTWSLSCLKRGGTLVLMGYDPIDPLPVNAKDMHYNEWKIAGTRLSTKQDLVELIELTERGELVPVVTRTLPLEDVNAGLDDVRRGAQVGRVVLEV